MFFSFNRFDAHNPAPADELFQSFPNLHFMLPEVVLIENESGAFLQVNSLGPVYAGRVERFARLALTAPHRTRRTVSYQLELDSRSAWEQAVGSGIDAIKSGRVEKVVLSRRLKLRADEPFSSKDLLVNLIDGTAHGTVLLYRYADVFFCGCTPELLGAQNRLRAGKHVPGGNVPGIARPRRERAPCARLAERCEEPRRA